MVVSRAASHHALSDSLDEQLIALSGICADLLAHTPIGDEPEACHNFSTRSIVILGINIIPD
jgi:hypothetical protein